MVLGTAVMNINETGAIDQRAPSFTDASEFEQTFDGQSRTVVFPEILHPDDRVGYEPNGRNRKLDVLVNSLALILFYTSRISSFFQDDLLMFACNPALREFRKLPDRPFGCPEEFEYRTEVVGFGFDPMTNDCKPLKVKPILCFDISSEAIREISHPQAERDDCIQSPVLLDNSLASIFYSTWPPTSNGQLIDIWVMMEYGVEESFIKKFFIGPFSIGIYCPLTCWNNDKLLLESSEGQLVSSSQPSSSTKDIPCLQLSNY
ncbi:hypothetical protein ACH5RR_011293 [Cinchona calisaya]|uniref:Uncharacterized protein n=1 Tax=Cinchona calisaya TaxID=153742 RepID=A0ABD3A830_9GENT